MQGDEGGEYETKYAVAVQTDIVINSDVDFAACESTIQHQSSGRVRIIYHFMTYFSTDILTKMYKLHCA